MSKINNNYLINLEQFKPSFGNGVKMKQENFLSAVANALNKLKERAEREVPENGDFAAVRVNFTNPEKNTYCDDFSVYIASDPLDRKNSRRLYISTEDPNFDKAISSDLFKGTKKEVLNYFCEYENLDGVVSDLLLSASEKIEKAD